MRDSESSPIAHGTLAAGVAEVLESRIREGRYLVGRPLPAERELAAEFFVSRGVIRVAIEVLARSGLLYQRANHRPVVREFTKTGHTGTRNLGVWLWPNSGHFSAASILKGIQSTNLGPNIQVTVSSGTGQDWMSVLDSERDFLEAMAANPATFGVIVWYLGGDQNLPALRKIQARKLPVVFVDRLPPEGFEVDYVGTNNLDSAMHAVQHLVRLGHKRIGMISNIDPASSVAEREEGFVRALGEAGIQIQDEWVQRTTYDGAEGVTAALDLLLGLSEPVTAVFCVNDLLALNAYDVLGRMGIRVPTDFSVIGFDGVLRWVPGGGYLTTMAQDFERMGRIAATMVVERAGGKGRTTNRHYLLDAPLLDGGSASFPKSSPPSFQSSQSLPGIQPGVSSKETYIYE